MPKLIQLKVFRKLRWLLARPAKKRPEKLYFFASKDGKTVPLISFPGLCGSRYDFYQAPTKRKKKPFAEIGHQIKDSTKCQSSARFQDDNSSAVGGKTGKSAVLPGFYKI